MEKKLFKEIIPIIGVLSMISTIVFVIISVWIDAGWSWKLALTSFIIFMFMIGLTQARPNQ